MILICQHLALHLQSLKFLDISHQKVLQSHILLRKGGFSIDVYSSNH